MEVVVGWCMVHPEQVALTVWSTLHGEEGIPRHINLALPSAASLSA